MTPMTTYHVTATAPTIEQLLNRDDTSKLYSPCFGYVEHQDGEYEWTMIFPPEAFKGHEDLDIGVGEYFYAMMCSTDFSGYPRNAAVSGWMWISQGWMTVHETEAELDNCGRPSQSPLRRHVEITLYLDHATGTLHHRFAPEGEEPVIQVLPCPPGGWGGSRGAVLAGMDHMRQEIHKYT